MFFLSEIIKNVNCSIKWLFVVARVDYEIGNYTVIEHFILEKKRDKKMTSPESENNKGILQIKPPYREQAADLGRK